MGYINEALESLKEDKYEFGQEGESMRGAVKEGEIYYFRTNSGWWRKCQVETTNPDSPGGCYVVFKDDRDTFDEYVLTSDLYTRDEALALMNKMLDDADKEWGEGPALKDNTPESLKSRGLKFSEYFDIDIDEKRNGAIYTLDSNGKSVDVEHVVFNGILGTEYPGRIVVYSADNKIVFDDDFDPHMFSLSSTSHEDQIPADILSQSVKQIKVVDHWGDIDWLIQL